MLKLKQRATDDAMRILIEMFGRGEAQDLKRMGQDQHKPRACAASLSLTYASCTRDSRATAARLIATTTAHRPERAAVHSREQDPFRPRHRSRMRAMTSLPTHSRPSRIVSWEPADVVINIGAPTPKISRHPARLVSRCPIVEKC